MRARGWRRHRHRVQVSPQAGWQPALHRIAAVALRRFGLASSTWAESFLLRFLRAVKRDAVFAADTPRVAAGRPTEDLRCPRADEADVLARQSVERIAIDAFALQQIAFHLAAISILSNAAAGGNDAMAGDDEWQHVARDDVGNGAHRTRTAHLLGE